MIGNYCYYYEQELVRLLTFRSLYLTLWYLSGLVARYEDIYGDMDCVTRFSVINIHIIQSNPIYVWTVRELPQSAFQVFRKALLQRSN